jgi:uncharacterized iron-regulated protein
MHAQNWKAPFDEEVTAAKGRHQQAIDDAHATFNKRVADEITARALRYENARDAFDALKPTPEAEGYETARQAFQGAKEPADHSEARAELDRAIRAADAAYHAEVARLGQEHGISVR